VERRSTTLRAWIALGAITAGMSGVAGLIAANAKDDASAVDSSANGRDALATHASLAISSASDAREALTATSHEVLLPSSRAAPTSSSHSAPTSSSHDATASSSSVDPITERDDRSPSNADVRAPRSSFAASLRADGALSSTAQEAHASAARRAPAHGERGVARGIALFAKKALVVGADGREVVDNPIVLVKDGKIEAVRPAREAPVPDGYDVVDCGDKWLAPGFIDLHCHIAGKSFLINDINDMVYLTNPELRVSPAVQPGNPNLLRGVAGGVTSVLFIPGSGTNMSGQGVLLKTGLDTYEEMQIRNPGSLKLAQAGNPERWAITVGRSFMNWNSRNTFRRGLAYAQQWKDFEDGKGPKPERNIQWDVFRELLAKRTQVSTHTQMYQVVEMTLSMVRQELGLDVYIDHGEFAGMRAAKQAQDLGVSAIVGPRELDGTIWQLSPGSDGKFIGIAAGYQEAGHKMIGFNTDSPIVPEEELPVQATVSVHYGFDDSHMDAVRGLTIVPAMTAGIDKRVGSLAPGKDADILVVTGDPIDPRHSVDVVFIEGRRVYDAQREKRRW
jgi:imidazolonepropionase-like amidohydrolase